MSAPAPDILTAATPSGRLEAGPRRPTSAFERLGAVSRHHLLVYRRTWRGSIIGRFLSPLFFLLSAGDPAPGQRPTWLKFWQLFGTSNQLLAGLSLLGVTVWLKRSGRRYWYTLAPMIFVMTITVWALATQAWKAFRDVTLKFDFVQLMNGMIAATLIALALSLVWFGVRAGWLSRGAPAGPTGAAASPGQTG